MRFKLLLLFVSITLLPAIPAPAQRAGGKSGAASSNTTRVDLSRERSGHESTKFLSMVGNWSIVDDGGKKVLAVDGRSWLRGQPAGSLAE
jgi:hypothetical protein